MKKFTKLVSLVLACALLFAMAIPMPASAAEEKITIKVETVNSTAGSKGVAVKVFVTADPTWSAIALTFNFDYSKLEYKSFALNPAILEQNGGGEPNVFVLNKNNASTGQVIVQLASAVVDGGYEGYHNTDSDGNTYDYLGTFKFNVNADVEGLAEINATVDKASCVRAGTTKDIATDVTNGGIQLPQEIAISGIADGAEINVYNESAPSATWTPANATATLNGAAYTAGTAISDVGEYTLVVTDGVNSKSISFTVINQEPPYEGVDMVIETVAAKAGDKGVAVKVFVPAEPYWSALGLTFTFDPDKLTYKSFTLNPAILEQNGGGEPNVYTLNKNNAATGEIIIGFATAVVDGGYEGYHNTDSDGNSYDYLGTFKFDVAADAADGLIDIKATIDKMSKMEGGETVDAIARIADGGIEITSCAHKWIETGRIAATCTDKGTINYTCEYDPNHTKTEDIEIDADAHDWTGNWVETKPASCTEKGEETLYCKHNNAHKQTRDVEIDPTAHDWNDWTANTDATCIAKATEIRVCKNDASHTETREIGEIDADAHDWNDWTANSDATCIAKATEIRVCKNNAAHTETREVGEIDADAHDWGKWEITQGATCVAKGTETRVCKNNPAHTEIRDIEIDETAHAWGNWETTQGATCIAKGTETRVCNNNPAHTETRDIEIDATAHDWNDWTPNTDATCIAKATEIRVCKNDASHTETREVGEIDAEAHDWNDWTANTAATCIAKATETRVCKNDASHTETREIGEIDAEAHDWNDWQVINPATCTDKGTETRVCKNNANHIEYREIEIDAEAHDWGEWEVTTPATATEKGVETRVCKNDASHTETRDIEPTGETNTDTNTNTSDNGVAAIALVALVAAAGAIIATRKKIFSK